MFGKSFIRKAPFILSQKLRKSFGESWTIMNQTTLRKLNQKTQVRSRNMVVNGEPVTVKTS